jgi:hypothetical protein
MNHDIMAWRSETPTPAALPCAAACFCFKLRIMLYNHAAQHPLRWRLQALFCQPCGITGSCEIPASVLLAG